MCSIVPRTPKSGIKATPESATRASEDGGMSSEGHEMGSRVLSWRLRVASGHHGVISRRLRVVAGWMEVVSAE